MSDNILGNPADLNAPETVVPEASPENNESGGGQESNSREWGGLIGENGAFAENWREFLPEDIRNEKCFDSMHTFSALAKSYVHSQKALGGKKIALPDSNSTEADWNAFYTALGRPETPEGYTTEGIELPEGVALDDGTIGKFRKFAHDNGISDKVFREAVAFDVARVAERVRQQAEADETEFRETTAKLKQEFGDRTGEVVAKCDKALAKFGLKDVFESHNLLNNYTVIKALADIGGMLSESTAKGGDEPFIPSSPERELEELQSDMTGALYNREHPGHDAALRRQSELLQKIARSRR